MSHSSRLHSIVICIAVLLQGCGGPKEPPPEPEPEPETAAMVLSALTVTGEKASAKVMRDGADSWEDAGVGAKLYPADRISVPEGVRALVRLESGDRIALREQASVQVVSPTALMLEKGELMVDGALSGVSTGLRVSADVASVGMEAALASLRLEDDQLRAAFVSGSGTVTAGDAQVTVLGGQEARVNRGQAVQVRSLSNSGPMFAWSEDLRLAARSDGAEIDRAADSTEGGLGTMTARAPESKKVLPFSMVSQDVDVRIQDQVAITRVEQVFENPTNQVVEGEYRFPIPPGARLTRFDMEIGGKLMPGEIVQRKKGRAIMKKVVDDFVEQMRDPALVEWESGSTFKTRIFPIKGKEKKRIVLSYIQTLKGVRGSYRYVLPLAVGGANSPTIPLFRMSARISGTQGAPTVDVPFYETSSAVKGDVATVDLEQKDFQPPLDLVLQIEHPERAEATMATFGKQDASAQDDPIVEKLKKAGKGQSGQDYFMLSFTPEITGTKPLLTKADDWIILVDTSQNRTPVEMQIQRNLVDAVVASLSFHDRVKILTYDMEATVLGEQWERPSFESLERIRDMLDGLGTGGATNLQAALSAAVEQAETERRTRILLLGDGAPTLGQITPAALADHVSTLTDGGDISVTTVGVGGSVDSLLMQGIAAQTGGKYLEVSAGEDLLATAVTLVSTIRAPVIEDASIDISGVEVADMAPADLGQLTSGEEVTVTGRYQGTGTVTVTLTGKVEGQDYETQYSFQVGEGKQANSFVPLIWACQTMDGLEMAGDEESLERAVEISRRFAIPCRETSFIVLENDAMYREFSVQHADDRYEWSGDSKVIYEEVDSALDSVLGSAGSAGSGVAPGYKSSSSSSSSIASLGKAKQASTVKGKIKHGTPVLDGGESSTQYKIVVQKVIRKRQSLFNHCYDMALQKNPGLKGMMALKFVITKYGQVSNVKVLKDNLNDSSLSSCIQKRFYALNFPQPEDGGFIFVTYPMKFEGRASKVTHKGTKSVASHDVTIRQLPPEIEDEKAQTTIDELTKKIDEEPLSRRHRQDLVDYYIRLARFDDASATLASWAQMDPTNPTVLVYRGDLARLRGDVPGALRLYSGVLDLDPDDTHLMEMIASYHETRGQWDRALPYRVTAHLRDPDTGTTVRRAVAEAMAGRMDDAKAHASTLLVETKPGTYKPAKKVKLTSSTQDVLVSILTEGKVPEDFDQVDREGADKAKISAVLTWKGDADLDLWVSQAKGSHMGGPWDDGVLVRSDSGEEGEAFYIPSTRTGTFRFFVICATAGGCGDTAAKLEVEALSKNRTIPFVMEGKWGAQPALVKVSDRGVFKGILRNLGAITF